MKKWYPLVAGFLLSVAAAGQSYEKKFPNADAVYTSLRCDVKIDREDGKLIATSNFSEDLVYLSSNSVNLMNRGYIYHSVFNKLNKFDAYIQVPDQKKKIRYANASTAQSRSDYIFYDDVKATSFDFAGAAVGTTRHLDYEIRNEKIELLSPYYFERYFPVAEETFTVSFPSDVKVKYIIRGLGADKVRFTETRKKDRTIYTFQGTDIEGYKSYPDAPDNAWYATHVIFYVEQTKENGEWKNFLSNPDDLYRKNFSFIRGINSSLSNELKNITDSLVRNENGEEAKARKIYRWVQQQIKYVAFEEGMEGFVPRPANLVCSRRFGDCKDMSSILTAMLNHAGIPAYFTWIGTRSIPYDYTDVPLPIVDNHMICAIRLNGQYIFLDGTDSGCIFGLPSQGIQGKQAMIALSEDKYEIVRVPAPPKRTNRLVDSTYLELAGKHLKGRIRVHLSGYYSSNLYSTLNYRTQTEQEDYFKRRFQRGNNKILFSNWKVTFSANRDEALVTADLELPDHVRELDNEWYLNLNLFKFYENEEIDFPKRKIPIERSFLEESRYVTVLTLPAGLQVSALPKSERYQNEVWGFNLEYRQSGNQVVLDQSFDTDQLMVHYEQFEPWNKVLEHLFPHYKHTVSIRKK